jgi:hypothetical protein
VKIRSGAKGGKRRFVEQTQPKESITSKGSTPNVLGVAGRGRRAMGRVGGLADHDHGGGTRKIVEATEAIAGIPCTESDAANGFHSETLPAGVGHLDQAFDMPFAWPHYIHKPAAPSRRR